MQSGMLGAGAIWRARDPLTHACVLLRVGARVRGRSIATSIVFVFRTGLAVGADGERTEPRPRRAERAARGTYMHRSTTMLDTSSFFSERT